MSSSESSETKLINEILVGVTFIAMIASILTCVAIYIFRDFRRKEAIALNPAEAAERRRRNMEKLERERSDSVLPTAGILKKDGELKKDSSGRRIRLSSDPPQEFSGSQWNKDEEEGESDPLLVSESNDSIRTGPPSSNLAESVEVALSVGITLTVHTMKASRPARISLSEGKLTCRIKKSMTLKVLQVDLKDVRSVVAGKATPNFQRPGLQSLPENTCFSVVTDTRTYDFEAMYEVERNALVQGLQRLVRAAQENSSSAFASAV